MKYTIDYTTNFKKQFKKIKKQNRKLNIFYDVVEKLSSGKELEPKYKNHKLINDKKYNNCYECHLEPDWLLVYKIEENELILLLFATGSHSELFR